MKDRSDRMDRLAVFPFSIGCVSQSAVSDANESSPKKPQQPDPSTTTPAEGAGKARGPSVLVVAGIQRLIKGFKNLSQMFVLYEEDEEEESEMVIGFPTDVQHVGHVGWDGLNKVSGMSMMNSWGAGDVGGGRQDHFLNLSSSLSLNQFELPMAAQGGRFSHK